jgi:hypothetical protein
LAEAGQPDITRHSALRSVGSTNTKIGVVKRATGDIG